MGVPAFFRWLTKKYPSVIVNANEERQKNADGVKIPIDCTQPNPNFQEFDNLYLDMNGIIHPCTHPEDRPPPKNEDEMFALIFEYIDRIFSIVRPRKLLYMAIDGVAPRAKMNQQRSRRFRASKEAWEKEASIEEQRRRIEDEGFRVPPKKPAETHFDSNCITPGTPFMARLAVVLRYYIHDRITNDPAWSKIEVILSDANVPGEGEHKIMDFIRKQRSNPAHDPDTVHCLCGADADLIMLGLATHEANFNIIREEFVPHQQRPCELCGQYGHELRDCKGLENEDLGPEQADPLQKEKSFIFLRVPILREYLEKELSMPNLTFPFDLERAIDDWVFLCFFVGNDFLPHLPSLEIRENAIDRLIGLYKDMVYRMNGYLTKDGEVYMDRVQLILDGLGQVEDTIFRRRQQNEENWKAKRARMGYDNTGRPAQRPAYVPQSGLLAPMATAAHLSGAETRGLAADARVQAMNFAENDEAAKRLKAMLKAPSESGETEKKSIRKRKHEGKSKNKKKKPENKKRKGNRPPPKQKQSPPTPKKLLPVLEVSIVEEITVVEEVVTVALVKDVSGPAATPFEEPEEPVDEIRFHESGWKDRYYRAKFEVGSDDIAFRRKVATAYIEGLCWVLKYYYQGCASWDWYFPYHYAPFASDFDTVSQYKPDFSRKTYPFKPLEQLMSVFPAASKQHLPEHWQKLMIADDSPIIDLYPADFRIDLNGKKFAWQGVALLPFVDEKRLLHTLESVYSTLTKEEMERNSTGPNRIFIGRHHGAFDFFKALYEGESTSMDIDPKLTYGLSGRISADISVVMPGAKFVSPVNDETCPDLEVNGGLMTIYEDPSYPENFIFPASRLPNATEIPKTLKPEDFKGNYRSQVGFRRDTPRAELHDSGRRHLNHELRSQSDDRHPRGRGGGGNRNFYTPQNDRDVYPQSYNGSPHRGRGGYNGNSRGGYSDGGYNNRGQYNQDQYQQNQYQQGQYSQTYGSGGGGYDNGQWGGSGGGYQASYGSAPYPRFETPRGGHRGGRGRPQYNNNSDNRR